VYEAVSLLASAGLKVTLKVQVAAGASVAVQVF